MKLKILIIAVVFVMVCVAIFESLKKNGATNGIITSTTEAMTAPQS